MKDKFCIIKQPKKMMRYHSTFPILNHSNTREENSQCDLSERLNQPAIPIERNIKTVYKIHSKRSNGNCK